MGSGREGEFRLLHFSINVTQEGGAGGGFEAHQPPTISHARLSPPIFKSHSEGLAPPPMHVCSLRLFPSASLCRERSPCWPRLYEMKVSDGLTPPVPHRKWHSLQTVNEALQPCTVKLVPIPGSIQEFRRIPLHGPNVQTLSC